MCMHSQPQIFFQSGGRKLKVRGGPTNIISAHFPNNIWQQPYKRLQSYQTVKIVNIKLVQCGSLLTQSMLWLLVNALHLSFYPNNLATNIDTYLCYLLSTDSNINDLSHTSLHSYYMYCIWRHSENILSQLNPLKCNLVFISFNSNCRCTIDVYSVTFFIKCIADACIIFSEILIYSCTCICYLPLSLKKVEWGGQ